MAGRRGLVRTALALFLLAAWRPAEAALETVPLAVHQGRCEAVLATENKDDQYYLILGALGHAGPYRVEVRTEGTTDALDVERNRAGTDPAWARTTRALADLQARARRQQNRRADYPPLASP